MLRIAFRHMRSCCTREQTLRPFERICSSKLVLRSELNNARVRAAFFSTDLAEGGTCCRWEVWISIAQARVGAAELWRIREVEELRSKLEAAPLLHWKQSLDCQVQIVLPGSTYEAYTAIAEVLVGNARSVWRLGSTHERIRIPIASASYYSG